MSRVQLLRTVEFRLEMKWFRLGMSMVKVRDEYGEGWKDFYTNLSPSLSP